MNRFLSAACLTIMVMITPASLADNLLNIVEYKIPKHDLIAFSATDIQVRLCSECAISRLKIPSTNVLFEKNTRISLDRATELYVRRDYNDLSVFVNREQARVEILRFGQVSELDTFVSAVRK